MSRTLSALLLSGCISNEFVAAEMERSLSVTYVAMVGGLLSTEIVSQVFGEPDETLRHGSSLCGCPCLSRFGASVPYVVQIDYASEGCVPTSGYLPTVLTGDATVDYDGARSTVTWSELLLGLQYEVAGPLSAEVKREGEVLELRASGALTFGAEQVDLDLSIVADAERIWMDGEAEVAGDPAAPLTFEGVDLPYTSVWADCSRPVAGTVSMPSRGTEAIVTFDAERVVVYRADRVSQAADWCAFRPDVL